MKDSLWATLSVKVFLLSNASDQYSFGNHVRDLRRLNNKPEKYSLVVVFLDQDFCSCIFFSFLSHLSSLVMWVHACCLSLIYEQNLNIDLLILVLFASFFSSLLMILCYCGAWRTCCCGCICVSPQLPLYSLFVSCKNASYKPRAYKEKGLVCDWETTLDISICHPSFWSLLLVIIVLIMMWENRAPLLYNPWKEISTLDCKVRWSWKEVIEVEEQRDSQVLNVGAEKRNDFHSHKQCMCISVLLMMTKTKRDDDFLFLFFKGL